VSGRRFVAARAAGGSGEGGAGEGEGAEGEGFDESFADLLDRVSKMRDGQGEGRGAVAGKRGEDSARGHRAAVGSAEGLGPERLSSRTGAGVSANAGADRWCDRARNRRIFPLPSPQLRAENGPGGHLDVFFEEEWAVDAEGEVAGAWDFLSARADVNEQGLEAGEDGEPWYQELREVWVIVFESGGEEGIYSLKTQAAAEGGEAGAEGEVDVDVVVAFEGQDDAARVASLLEGYMPFEPLVVGQR